MTKWIKKWDKCSNDTGTTQDDDVKSMNTKMKNALKYRSENPKKIDEFEDIYMRPQPSNIIEGLENQEDDDDDELDEPDNPFNLITNPIDNYFIKIITTKLSITIGRQHFKYTIT